MLPGLIGRAAESFHQYPGGAFDDRTGGCLPAQPV